MSAAATEPAVGPRTDARAGGRLAGKVAIVTGASQGIGRAIAVAFAGEGAQVVAAARDLANLRETARLAGGAVIPHACDVTRADKVRDLVAFAEERLGSVHVMVNNAGVAYASSLTEMPEELWDVTMDVNVKGTFLGCKYAIPAIARAGGGSVINLGSITSFLGQRLGGAYAASKGAVLMLTKSVACEAAEAGVRVNLICPGPTATSMVQGYAEAREERAAGERWLASHQPLTGIMAPQDVASVAVFLASDASRAMTGAAVVVDGGLSAAWDNGPGPHEAPAPVRQG